MILPRRNLLISNEKIMVLIVEQEKSLQLQTSCSPIISFEIPLLSVSLPKMFSLS